NENQDAINNIAKINVPLSILFLGFLGPICEELTYRVGLFNFTRRVNRIMGYVISAAIFGLIHIHDYGSLNEWLSYPSYLFAGLAFAFAYEKWGFGASTLAHVTNNVLSLLIVAIVQQ
ncbi:MAG: CPBP family intramembrane metalloprotease, partial [Bacilli bacterium]|nr:CPBP family intramembrane metalloprotease [Bacilli bacterium]